MSCLKREAKGTPRGSAAGVSIVMMLSTEDSPQGVQGTRISTSTSGYRSYDDDIAQDYSALDDSVNICACREYGEARGKLL